MGKGDEAGENDLIFLLPQVDRDLQAVHGACVRSGGSGHVNKDTTPKFKGMVDAAELMGWMDRRRIEFLSAMQASVKVNHFSLSRRKSIERISPCSAWNSQDVTPYSRSVLIGLGSQSLSAGRRYELAHGISMAADKGK